MKWHPSFFTVEQTLVCPLYEPFYNKFICFFLFPARNTYTVQTVKVSDILQIIQSNLITHYTHFVIRWVFSVSLNV